MRADKRDIIELFGYQADDISAQSRQHTQTSTCPFTNSLCTKTNHDKSVIYGACSVTHGITKDPGSEVIICPNRLYAEKYKVLTDVITHAWPNSNLPLVVGGTLEQLREKASIHQECVVAFGKSSGKEIAVKSSVSMSMDWVLQRYKLIGNNLEALDYVGIEVQSIDTTQNYRDNWKAYIDLRAGKKPNHIPNSEHGLNWANVHKRLIPQIIRKGNIYNKSQKCLGFYFILPETVYAQFEKVLGQLPAAAIQGNDTLSILTYQLGKPVSGGKLRKLNSVKHIRHKLQDIIKAFSTDETIAAAKKLEQDLYELL